ARVVQSRNPIGYRWIICYDYDDRSIRLTFIPCGRGGKLLPVIQLSCAKTVFKLVRPDGVTFIQNIVNHSHRALLEGLREMDPKAMMFLLFRAFYYYLCEDFRIFRSDEFPNFFRAEEHEQLAP